MTYRSQKDALRSLTALAATQGGYFTAKQAEEAGYDFPHLVYHLKAGNFERAGQRVREFQHCMNETLHPAARVPRICCRR
ncbi:MAG: hypothetical protein HBSAPP03_02220 [Phycisphaerae bacterium]|nr:MAG: hypothetical protein HBSAPP03_02220 [Phycisphaerae bacterium]